MCGNCTPLVLTRLQNRWGSLCLQFNYSSHGKIHSNSPAKKTCQGCVRNLIWTTSLASFSIASWSCLKLGKSLFGQKKLLRNIYQAARLSGERVGRWWKHSDLTWLARGETFSFPHCVSCALIKKRAKTVHSSRNCYARTRDWIQGPLNFSAFGNILHYLYWG